MLIAIQIDVVVVVIDRVHESLTFMHFVGMPIAPCFKLSGTAFSAATLEWGGGVEGRRE